MVVNYGYQDFVKMMNVWVDIDYMGCRRARRSSAGAIAMLGNHPVKSWSTTQAIIALSSGEAEYYGIVKGSSVGMGIKSVLADLGVNVKLRISTDASAAKGIASRRGAGKTRHIEVNQLWVQEKVANGEIELQKVRTQENLADALTKHVDGEKLRWHVQSSGQRFREGRHLLMPALDAV